MKKIQKIGFVGAGNVATHLSHAFFDAGYDICWIWSRTEIHAKKLASNFGSVYTKEFKQDLPGTDLIIVSVNDDAVKNVVGHLGKCSSLIIHTGGSLPMDILLPALSGIGVLYPVQTFTETRDVNIREVPLCIEASDKKHLERLKELASAISDHVYEMNTQQRLCLHIAAVFANNFSNYMYTMANEVLNKCGLPDELLHPLMKETTAKAIELTSSKVQTGPAARGDIATIKTHLEWLKHNKDMHDVYDLLSMQLIKISGDKIKNTE